MAATPQFRLSAALGTLTITPEQFGARGDGVTNDTAAFAKMADYVNRRGGGQIALRPTTYLVGRQSNARRDTQSTGYAFAPTPILTLNGCTGPVAIQGNGARLRCANGLRFGTFDPVTGLPTYHQLPYSQRGEWASPYQAMILIQNCTSDVSVENIELDGNLAGLQIGGPFGDGGWQLPGDGLRLVNNSGNERVVQVTSHHHARDGLLIIGVANRTTSSLFKNVASEYNARQGCSVVNGVNYTFVDSKFNHSGRATIMSPPGSGVDIEAEDSPIRNIGFSGCEFSNNSGCGMVAASGDSEGLTFEKCRFIGTTTWSAWPNKPLTHFSDCVFVGAVVSPFIDPDPARATQFLNCAFVDDPALSPTGKTFGPSQPIVNMGASKNVLFDGCRFDLKTDAVMPWSWEATYNNCTMSQVSTEMAHPKGIYTGTCSINGVLELYGAIIRGQLTINGYVELGGAVIAGDLTVNGQLVPRNA